MNILYAYLPKYATIGNDAAVKNFNVEALTIICYY